VFPVKARAHTYIFNYECGGEFEMVESSRREEGSGGAQGRSSDASPSAEEPQQDSGDIEVPIGVPVSEEEFRRLKEAARRHEDGADAMDEE
jgi:hypothetical protein